VKSGAGVNEDEMVELMNVLNRAHRRPIGAGAGSSSRINRAPQESTLKLWGQVWELLSTIRIYWPQSRGHAESGNHNRKR